MHGLLDINYGPAAVVRGDTRLKRVRHDDLSATIGTTDQVGVLVNLSGGHQVRGWTGKNFWSEIPWPGSVSILPPCHSFRVQVSGRCSVLLLRINWRELSESAMRTNLNADRLAVKPRINVEDPVLMRCVVRIAAADTALARDTAIVSLTNHLVASESRQPSRPRSIGLTGPVLRRVFNFMHSEMAGELSLSTLAGEAGMSLHHFARCFKQATGYAPHQYLVRHRVGCALNLLAQTDLATAEVARRADFSHSAHQARHVRRLTGLSPQAYREKVLP